MNWEFIFASDAPFLEIKVSGEMRKDRMNEMATQALAEMTSRKISRALLDYLEITKMIDIMDIYDRPKDLQGLGVSRQIRICLLVKKEHIEKFKFAETVYRNQGFDYGIFTERDAAIRFIAKEIG